jgi:hypothetical protein
MSILLTKTGPQPGFAEYKYEEIAVNQNITQLLVFTNFQLLIGLY